MQPICTKRNGLIYCTNKHTHTHIGNIIYKARHTSHTRVGTHE